MLTSADSFFTNSKRELRALFRHARRPGQSYITPTLAGEHGDGALELLEVPLGLRELVGVPCLGQLHLPRKPVVH